MHKMRGTVHTVVLSVGACVLFGGSTLAGCGDDTGESTSNNTPEGSCAPAAGCPSVDSDCLALFDNAGADEFALRISQLTIETPMALNTGLVETVVADGVTLNLDECKSESNFVLQDGLGTFSWILEFNRTANTLRTGGADVTANPNDGYCLLNEDINGFQVEPLTVDATIADDGSITVSGIADVTVPIFADATATSAVLLPLKSVQLTEMTLSADQNCVGSFNQDLTPNNLCLPLPDQGTFVDGGRLDGYVILEDADMIEVEAASNSLCVLLTANVGKYGLDGKCTRDDAGEIEFKGDWCAASDSPATADCYDAVRLGAGFTAIGVKLNDDC